MRKKKDLCIIASGIVVLLTLLMTLFSDVVELYLPIGVIAGILILLGIVGIYCIDTLLTKDKE